MEIRNPIRLILNFTTETTNFIICILMKRPPIPIHLKVMIYMNINGI